MLGQKLLELSLKVSELKHDNDFKNCSDAPFTCAQYDPIRIGHLIGKKNLLKVLRSQVKRFLNKIKETIFNQGSPTALTFDPYNHKRKRQFLGSWATYSLNFSVFT